MGVGSGLYMYDVVVKRSRSLSHLLMSSCLDIVRITRQTHRQAPVKTLPRDCLRRGYKKIEKYFLHSISPLVNSCLFIVYLWRVFVISIVVSVLDPTE